MNTAADAIVVEDLVFDYPQQRALHGSVLAAVLPGALQAALLWAVVGARWRRRQARWEETKQP